MPSIYLNWNKNGPQIQIFYDVWINFRKILIQPRFRADSTQYCVWFKWIHLNHKYTEKNLTLKSNLYQRSEATIIFCISWINKNLSWFNYIIELNFNLYLIQFSFRVESTRVFIDSATQHIIDSDPWKRLDSFSVKFLWV